MEGQRNECLEPAGLVLQRARAEHVVDPFLVRFDVPVQHRHVRSHPKPVRETMNRKVPIGVRLVVGDLAAHAFGKDLGTTAG